MKHFITAAAAALVFFSCLKSNDHTCQPVSPASEAAKMAAFCNSNSLTYKVDSASGIFYQVLAPGAGDSIKTSSSVNITYKGTLLDNTVFDSSTITSYPLGGFIAGWQIAIPWVRKGGHIKMVIPSSLAYACFPPSKTIPENAPLYFDVTVNDVH